MNLSLNKNYTKLNDLCDQIFDYFNLTNCDLDSKIGINLSIDSVKNKLETFSDKHFKSAFYEFKNEIQELRNHFPKELAQLEKITEEIMKNFNSMINRNSFDRFLIIKLHTKIRNILKFIE